MVENTLEPLGWFYGLPSPDLWEAFAPPLVLVGFPAIEGMVRDGARSARRRTACRRPRMATFNLLPIPDERRPASAAPCGDASSGSTSSSPRPRAR